MRLLRFKRLIIKLSDADFCGWRASSPNFVCVDVHCGLLGLVVERYIPIRYGFALSDDLAVDYRSSGNNAWLPVPTADGSVDVPATVLAPGNGATDN